MAGNLCARVIVTTGNYSTIVDQSTEGVQSPGHGVECQLPEPIGHEALPNAVAFSLIARHLVEVVNTCELRLRVGASWRIEIPDFAIPAPCILVELSVQARGIPPSRRTGVVDCRKAHEATVRNEIEGIFASGTDHEEFSAIARDRAVCTHRVYRCVAAARGIKRRVRLRRGRDSSGD